MHDKSPPDEALSMGGNLRKGKEGGEEGGEEGPSHITHSHSG